MLRAFVLSVVVVSMGWAQEDRASISGQVTDPSGSAVPNAQVTVTSVERNTVSKAASTETGRYQVGFLLPGRYTLSVEAPGFKKYVRQNIQLQVAEKLGLDVPLEIGAPAESITITEQAGLLETESAGRGQVVTHKELTDIPNNGHVVMQLVWAVVGVTRTTNSWGSMGVSGVANATNFSINGGRPGENEVLLDGVSDVAGDRQVKHIPQIETVQEFKVSTNAFDAQYGRTGGGVISFTTKSGTNQLHGVAWEYHRTSSILTANVWAYNRLGIPLPKIHMNSFGFLADGPVYLPKLFNGRNKLFFMFSYDGYRYPGVDGANFTLPQPEQYQGDFSKLLNGVGQLAVIYDPKSTRLDKGALVRDPFPGNRISGDRLNPIAVKAASFYPKPNLLGETPARLYNYSKAMPSSTGHNQEAARMDWAISSKNRVHFRYSNTPYQEIRYVRWGDNVAEPSGNAPLTRNGVNWSSDWTDTLTPSTVFNLRFGLTRWEDFAGNTYGRNYDPRQLGFPDSLVGQFKFLQFPAFSFSGAMTYGPIGSTRPGDFQTDYAYSLQPNINLVRGGHILKIGADFKRFEKNRISLGLVSGGYTFAKAFTQADPLRADAFSGNEFAAFLLGYAAGGQVDNNMQPAYKSYYYSGFVQDDWKVSARLTLNLGFRYDYEAPLAERYNRMVRGFAFNQPSPIAAQVKGLDLKGGLLFAGTSGESRLAFNRDLKHFQPRAGFAWRLGQNWVLRGGYGVFFMGQYDEGPGTGFSQPTPMIASADGGLTPRVTLSNPFPEPLLVAIGNSRGLATNLGQGIVAQYLDRRLPYSQQVSFGIQRQLPGGWVVESSYSGNFTRRLRVDTSVNNIPASELGRSSAYYVERVANPMAGLLPDNAAKNATTIPRQELMVPFPQYSGFTLTGLPIGLQNYNALQSTLKKRFARGFTFQAAYTISKALEAVSFLNAQDFNLASPLSSPLEYRLAQWDTPQKLAIISTYELPVGRGKRHGASLHPVWNALVGGWQLNGNLTFQSGFPIAFPNAPPVAARSAKLPSDKRSLYQWFDTSLWKDPATGRPVPVQAPYTLRDFPTRFPDVRFSTLKNLDLSLFKDFPIYERLRFNLRIETNNVSNTPWFSSLATNNVTAANFGNLTLSSDNAGRSFGFTGRLVW